MSTRHAGQFGRRSVLGGMTLAGIAALLGAPPRLVAAEPTVETRRLRLARVPAICVAPEYVAEDLLKGEGFSELQYVKLEGTVAKQQALAAGEIDLTLHFSAPLLMTMEAGDPIVILAGVHTGCFELIGTERIRSIRDLKGKTVAVHGLGSAEHVFLASMTAYVGLDPHQDVQWVTYSATDSVRFLVEGKIDAFLGFPPFPQEVRARKIGRVVVNSSVDRPWSQYFCCMVAANREFVQKHPVATKRALRALLKATDICALEPDRAARFLVDKEYVKRYDYALQTMKEVPYGRWRDYGAEDTVRFYALRLREAKMIKSSPQKLIAQGTDWRFLNELKKELKG